VRSVSNLYQLCSRDQGITAYGVRTELVLLADKLSAARSILNREFVLKQLDRVKRDLEKAVKRTSRLPVPGEKRNIPSFKLKRLIFKGRYYVLSHAAERRHHSAATWQNLKTFSKVF
jgi:hypothetical protein